MHWLVESASEKEESFLATVGHRLVGWSPPYVATLQSRGPGCEGCLDQGYGFGNAIQGNEDAEAGAFGLA